MRKLHQRRTEDLLGVALVVEEKDEAVEQLAELVVAVAEPLTGTLLLAKSECTVQ
jgi:hypothetical protein